MIFQSNEMFHTIARDLSMLIMRACTEMEGE